MLNALCKGLLAGSISLMLFSGCSGDSKAAKKMIGQAQSLSEAGDYKAALAILDSVDTRYGAHDVERTVGSRQSHSPAYDRG